jgi:hypothetical protein
LIDIQLESTFFLTNVKKAKQDVLKLKPTMICEPALRLWRRYYLGAGFSLEPGLFTESLKKGKGIGSHAVVAKQTTPQRGYPVATVCPKQLILESLFSKEVIADFDGGRITSNAGARLLGLGLSLPQSVGAGVAKPTGQPRLIMVLACCSTGNREIGVSKISPDLRLSGLWPQNTILRYLQPYLNPPRRLLHLPKTPDSGHLILVRNYPGYKGYDVVSALNLGVPLYGVPECIRVDNGPEFISKEIDLWA